MTANPGWSGGRNGPVAAGPALIPRRCLCCCEDEGGGARPPLEGAAGGEAVSSGRGRFPPADGMVPEGTGESRCDRIPQVPSTGTGTRPAPRSPHRKAIAGLKCRLGQVAPALNKIQVQFPGGLPLLSALW